MADRHRISGPKGYKKKKKVYTPKSTRGKVKKLAHEVKAIKKEMKREVEVKNYDDTLAITSIDYNGILSVNLLPITQGIQANARIGDEIMCTGFEFRYVVAAGTTTANSKIRVMMVQDFNNVLSSVTEYLNSLQVGTALAPLAFFNRANRGDYKVLYDKVHEFDFGTGNLQQIGMVKVPNKIPVKYVTGGSTLVTENGIRMIAISDTAPAGGRPTINGYWRFYYTDQ